MDILEGIFTRRSVRKFTGKPVTEEQLKTILKAGFCAPSAGNQQPWQFVVVREKKVLEDIVNFHKYARMLPSAGCGIVVCGDRQRQGSEGFLLEDCAAAIENMWLAAHGQGLGAVWCGLYPNTEISIPMGKLLKLPETVVPVGLLVVGNKGEDRGFIDRWDENKIHYDQW
jgi:nitroreductase